MFSIVALVDNCLHDLLFSIHSVVILKHRFDETTKEFFCYRATEKGKDVLYFNAKKGTSSWARNGCQCQLIAKDLETDRLLIDYNQTWTQKEDQITHDVKSLILRVFTAWHWAGLTNSFIEHKKDIILNILWVGGDRQTLPSKDPSIEHQ
jgi:hypothetical protein